MSVGPGRQNILILFWKLQINFWKHINDNKFILDSHRSFICSVYTSVSNETVIYFRENFVKTCIRNMSVKRKEVCDFRKIFSKNGQRYFRINPIPPLTVLLFFYRPK
jgi:hypothetical protein